MIRNVVIVKLREDADLAHAIRMIPRPEAPVPTLALPTAILFIAASTMWAVSTVLALTDTWSWPLSVPVNAVAAFALFTVAHEAAHRTLSTHAWVNGLIGRLANLFYIPHASFGLFRYCHMQHHRFTNHDDGSDPDHYAGEGHGLGLLVRWLTIDFAYGRFYIARRAKRPRAERIEAVLTAFVILGMIVAGVVTGNALLVVGLWLLPARMATTALAWSFDYLPHHGIQVTPAENRFRTTRNRIGLERLLTPMMLYQNYHLVHHLHPIIPFYKYIAVWRRNESAYLANDPELCDPRGRPITAAEYGRMRELAEHH